MWSFSSRNREENTGFRISGRNLLEWKRRTKWDKDYKIGDRLSIEMEKVEMNLVLAVCKQSLQREIPQWQISVFNYKHQGEGEMKVISFESVRQAALMWGRKSKVLNKYESNSDWLNGSWKEGRTWAENYPKGSRVNNLNLHVLWCLCTVFKGGKLGKRR